MNSPKSITNLDTILKAVKDNSNSAINTVNASGNVDLDVTSKGELGFQLTGVWVGSLTALISIDGVNFDAVVITNVATEAKTASVTANGSYKIKSSGLKTIRLTWARTSGTLTITSKAL